MKPIYTARLYIKLQPELKEALLKRVEHDDKEMSEFVRELLELSLKGDKK